LDALAEGFLKILRVGVEAPLVIPRIHAADL
jgi:hypothetical protein